MKQQNDSWLKFCEKKIGDASLFYEVISNWLSLSYQTNRNIDLLSTTNQNDLTRSKNNHLGIIVRYPNNVIQLIGKVS